MDEIKQACRRIIDYSQAISREYGKLVDEPNTQLVDEAAMMIQHEAEKIGQLNDPECKHG